MAEYNLNDAQWCVLDMLMRAREKGVHVLNRMELLNSPSIPQSAAMKLTFAALTIPVELVEWQGKHDFSITEAGVSLYNLRFGTGTEPATPSDIGDDVICLPDLSGPGPRH